MSAPNSATVMEYDTGGGMPDRGQSSSAEGVQLVLVRGLDPHLRRRPYRYLFPVSGAASPELGAIMPRSCLQHGWYFVSGLWTSETSFIWIFIRHILGGLYEYHGSREMYVTDD